MEWIHYLKLALLYVSDGCGIFDFVKLNLTFSSLLEKYQELENVAKMNIGQFDLEPCEEIFIVLVSDSLGISDRL